MSYCLIILAGGNSHRFSSNIGKPYQKIAGKSLIEINVDKARKFKQIKKIVLVYNKKDLKRVKSLKLKNIKLIRGGRSRQQSTLNALKYLNSAIDTFLYLLFKRKISLHSINKLSPNCHPHRQFSLNDRRPTLAQ